MRLLAGDSGLKRVIREPTVNRPGLALSGFTRYFAYKRVQAMGHAEVYYLRSLSRQEREKHYAAPVCLQNPVLRVQPRPPAGQGIFGGGGQGRRAGFPDAAGDDEVHQRRDARAGNDVRAARHRAGQHGGHPGRGRHHPRRKRHRQKRGRAGTHRARLQPGGRRRRQGHARGWPGRGLHQRRN